MNSLSLTVFIHNRFIVYFFLINKIAKVLITWFQGSQMKNSSMVSTWPDLCVEKTTSGFWETTSGELSLPLRLRSFTSTPLIIAAWMLHSYQPINFYFHEYAVWIFGNIYLLRILRFSFFGNALMMFCLLYILMYIVDKVKLRVFLQHFQDA